MTDDKAAAAARRLLEQRIAQLETDAKEQDKKAQVLLANVQSRFNSVQSKYETHISDLETQVLKYARDFFFALLMVLFAHYISLLLCSFQPATN